LLVAVKPKAIPEIVQELWQLLKDYARQETVDPLRGLGRYLGYGLGGAALISLGLFFLALSLLRVLQTKTGDAFTGWRSALPYLIVLIVAGGVAAVAATRINKASKAAKAKGTTP
jgi:hypothetical protein